MTVLPLPPTTNHGYALARGRMYKTKETNAWFLVAKQRLKLREPHYGATPVGVVLYFYFPNRRRRDIDGSIKYVLDVLGEKYANIITDDSQITDLHVHKRFSEEAPRIEIDFFKTQS